MKKFIPIIFFCLVLVSCEKKDTGSDLTLQKSSFDKLEGWQQDNQADAFRAFMYSCKKIEKEKGAWLSKSKIKVSSKDYKKLCQQAVNLKQDDFRRFLEKNFTPYLVLWQSDSKGKFTSYYESELRASKTKSSKYKYPIYSRPNDLIEVNLHDFDKTLPDKRIVGRVENNRLIPYYTRNEIYQKGIDAPVVLWGDDYIDIYIMQIQGSAVAKLDDGSELRIAFADTNGHEFKGIGSILLEQNLLPVGEASMLGIKKWLHKNPEIAVENMNKNHRYVFHRINPEDGPLGAQGVPLTAGRSLAVDRSFVPLGSLLWLETTGPKKEKINKLVVAQDIGGAIKGAIRGDYFWGSGNDEVLDLAGKMNSQGQYYILVPKTQEVVQ